MFSGFFGSTKVDEDTKSEIIKNIYSQNTHAVISLINHHHINLDDTNLLDESQQNLLHIAVRTKNLELVKFLMNKKINKQKLNMFGETALDIAIKNHDKKMIEVLLYVEAPIIMPYYQQIIKKDDYSESSRNVDKLTEELNTEKQNCKRKRDECNTLSNINTSLKNENTDLVIENGKLKIENKKLKADNNELQKTIKTLRESFKK